MGFKISIQKGRHGFLVRLRNGLAGFVLGAYEMNLGTRNRRDKTERLRVFPEIVTKPWAWKVLELAAGLQTPLEPITMIG